MLTQDFLQHASQCPTMYVMLRQYITITWQKRTNYVVSKLSPPGNPRLYIIGVRSKVSLNSSTGSRTGKNLACCLIFPPMDLQVRLQQHVGKFPA